MDKLVNYERNGEIENRTRASVVQTQYTTVILFPLY
jgi:hypothetical protein